MRIATYRWGGRRHVGLVAADAKSVTPLALGEHARSAGALALIERLSEGGPMPGSAGASLPLSAISLDAPIPRPRRNIFCSGVNYRTHAAEWAASGMDGARSSTPTSAESEYPVIFSKVPDCVIGPGDPIRMPGGLSRANASTRDLIFAIPALIEAISASITLVPGDIIATGTPGGVGIGFSPPKYLASGDVVRIEIDGIGVLENPVS